MTETIGFIGLGAMGLGIAANLVKGGHEVVGFDTSAERRALAAERGIVPAGDAEEVIRKATSTVFSAVRTTQQTLDLLRGLELDRPLTIVVLSTLDPGSMRQLADELAEHQVVALDATMTGGAWGADAGTLTFMVSCPDEVFVRVRPLLELAGEQIFHVGDHVGTAQATKLAVQLAWGINMLGALEALRFAQRYGVAEDQLMAILSKSVGASWASQNWERIKPWWQVHEPGGDLEIILKDLRSALRDADENEAFMPMTAMTFQLLRHVWDGSGSDQQPGSA